MNDEWRPQHQDVDADASMALIGFLAIGLSGALVGFGLGFLLCAWYR
jgi:hypothetical protein